MFFSDAGRILGFISITLGFISGTRVMAIVKLDSVLSRVFGIILQL